MRDSEYILYENTPADTFCEAYPIGNGHLGGMVYGNLPSMRLSLNRDDLWTGCEQEDLSAFSKADYEEARDLALHGEFDRASEILSEKLGRYDSSAYMPLGDLYLSFPDGRISDYRRSLDLRDALARVSFMPDGGRVELRYFASHPDGVIVAEVVSESPIDLFVGATVRFERSVSYVNDILVFDGECPMLSDRQIQRDSSSPDMLDKKTVAFAMALSVLSDGDIRKETRGYTVSSCKTLRVVVSCESSYADGYARAREGFRTEAIERVSECEKSSTDALLCRHFADVHPFFDRVFISLGEFDRSDVPTSVRIRTFETKDGTIDTDLITLAFNFGRYLTVAASRAGTLPTNLQGIWNESKTPPWSSNYTTNINTEMNYWHTPSCDLMDLCQPLEQLAALLVREGKKSAKALFGVGGACAFHNADPFGHATPASGMTRWSFFPLSLAWIVRQLYENYEYTENRDDLVRIYPLIREASEFVLDMLIDDGHYLVIAPGTSAENSYTVDGKECDLALSSTFFGAITRDILTIFTKASVILQRCDPLADRARAAMPRLLPLRILPDGRIEEFYFGDTERPYSEVEPTHRHISHLYDLYPARNVTKNTPELYRAATLSLDGRGDASTGWSLAWKMNCRARLDDADAMMRLLRLYFTAVRSDDTQTNLRGGGGVYPNLFCAHPPFQIDGNFGVTSAIVEMLVGERDGETVFLPALPKQISSGKVRGIRLPHGRRVDFSFRGGKIVSSRIY